jgi:hypothetical protein
MLFEGTNVSFMQDSIIRVCLEHTEVEAAPFHWRGSIEQVASGRIK